MPASVLVSADLRTLDDRMPRAEAIAWRDGRVLAVGTEAEVLAAAGEGASRMDVGGATVLPGFVDPHHHASIVALYGGLVRLEPPAVKDIASLQRELARAARATPEGWLVATSWNEALLAERRAPTRAELDDAVPDRPLVALHYSCHRAVANSRALEAAGIDRHTPSQWGGEIGRGKDGLPNGLLVERAMSAVEARARASLVATDAEGFLERLGAHYRGLVAAGITRVVDATVPADLAALYREADRRRLLLVPTVTLPVSTHGYLEAPVDALDGPPTGLVDGKLEMGPVKLVFDGAPGCAMCLGWLQTAGTTLRAFAMAIRRGSLAPVRASLSVEPRLGRDVRTGILLYREEEADAVLAAARDRRFAVATHAIGNRAIRMALDAYERAGPRLADAGRPRLEHASFLDPELVRRIAGSGAMVVTQPHFLTLPVFDETPPVPGLRNMALRWMLDAGITVAGSSDHPVAGYAPLDGIRSAVRRRTRSGHAYEADQAITLDEAIVLYTRAAAEATHALDRCGSLAAGKRADLVILDSALSLATLDDVAVKATIVGGEVVYSAL